MTRFALFAAGDVGREIARFFGDQQERLACLVVSSADDNDRQQDIVELARAEHVIHSDVLYEPGTLALLRTLDLDYVILAWWPDIIRADIITLPRLGCLNFHPSYLPYNRGKHYNFWNLVEDVPFGVTLHWVDETVDGGAIAFQQKIETGWEDTGATLFAKAQRAIVQLFIEHYERISAGDVPRIPQDPAAGSFHLARELDAASRIDLEQAVPARDLLNLLRARTFKPHPGAWFVDHGEKYEVRIEIRKVSDNE